MVAKQTDDSSEKDVEAKDGEESHYLHLADGSVKRYAPNPEDPYAPIPTHFNGVRVISAHGR